jgi:hypothetical protein
MTDPVLNGLMKRRATLTHDIEETHDRLTRISHMDRCIGVRNQGKLFCDNDLPGPKGIPDADRV